jgi:hypothetical protein
LWPGSGVLYMAREEQVEWGHGVLLKLEAGIGLASLARWSPWQGGPPIGLDARRILTRRDWSDG